MATTCSVLDGLRRHLGAGRWGPGATPALPLRQTRWCWVAGLMVPMCGLAATPDTPVVESDAADIGPLPVVSGVSDETRAAVLPGVPAPWQPAAAPGRSATTDARGGRVAPAPIAPVDLLPASLVATAVQQRGSGLAVAPGGRSVEGVSYRWWLSGGRSDLGLGVGVIGLRGLRSEGGTPVSAEPPQAGFQASQPLLTLGWRYQVNPGSVVYADAYGMPGAARPWSGAGMATGDLYSAKVGVEWARQRNGWGFERGGLGLQLDGGSKMSLRLRRGGVGVYMRSQF